MFNQFLIANTTAHPSLTMPGATSALEIVIGGVGGLLFGTVAIALLAIVMFGRQLLPSALASRPIDNLTCSAYAALLALLYLIVGTNTVTWSRPGGDDHPTNLLRVVLGMLFNITWLDAASRWWFPAGEARDRLLRPVVAVLVFFGTLTIASSPGAREFALFVVTISITAAFVLAHVFWNVGRFAAVDLYFVASVAICTFGGFSFLWLGELLSPSFLGVYGNAIALLMMLFGHACIGPVLYIFIVLRPPWKDDTATTHIGLSADSEGDHATDRNSLYGYDVNDNAGLAHTAAAAAAAGSTEGHTDRDSVAASTSNGDTVPLNAMSLTLTNDDLI